MSSETLQSICLWFGLFTGLIALLCGAGYNYFGQQVQKEKEAITEAKEKEKVAREASTGVLKPEQNIIFPPQLNSSSESLLEFGSSGTILAFAQAGEVIKFANDNALKLSTDTKGIKVSIAIKNKSGKLVAELIENEWKIKHNDLWDRNYSQNALEVKDNAGDIIFQVRLIENRVQLQAKIYDSNGRGIGIHGDKEGGYLELTGTNRPTLDFKIEPIFKYPSDLHLGEFVSKQSQP
ncbi:MAG: hypothetical protein H0X72_05880 [Acidobacteria bacterium]|jgi:hypothetical protein|nr:hypothetical protein [Acidobacteriota bacterium]